jgi:SAM-dependent methyltransferase
MSASELPDHVARNRLYWDEVNAPRYAEAGARHWREEEITWGVWGVPETELRLLPEELSGKDVIELGCGTAYVSAWLARRGARVTGIDNSPKQLETARRLQAAHGLDFPLLLGNAEEVPLPDGSFDLAVSEYGAAIWCDPYRWIPESARLLRPGGELMFLGNHAFYMPFAPDEDETPATETLVRPYFGMHRFEWPDDDESVEFHLPHGEMLRLLRASGFEVVDLVEIQAPERTPSTQPYVTPEWARRWPAEEAWRARKVG